MSERGLTDQERRLLDQGLFQRIYNRQVGERVHRRKAQAIAFKKSARPPFAGFPHRTENNVGRHDKSSCSPCPVS